MYRRARARKTEDTIKITAHSVERVDEIVDRLLEIYRCVVSPIRDKGEGCAFCYLTIIEEMEE